MQRFVRAVTNKYSEEAWKNTTTSDSVENKYSEEAWKNTTTSDSFELVQKKCRERDLNVFNIFFAKKIPSQLQSKNSVQREEDPLLFSAGKKGERPRKKMSR